jgi:uncharacterized membrane protein YcaP (DUF421 family)
METGDGVVPAIRNLLGIDVPATEMDVGQVVARALLIYLAGLLILRVGQHRFLGKNTAFDIVLGFILGSMLSRAVNGSAALGPTVLACAALVALHWLFAFGAFRWHRLGALVKGGARQLVRGGEIDWNAMRRAQISRRDLEEAMRSDARVDDLSQIDSAYFERSGRISFIPKGREPRVIEIDVADGVQTVRVVVE